MLKIQGCVKCLFLNNENNDACLPSYLRINMTNLVKKNKYQILAYHVNNTYAKLINTKFNAKQKIEEIMCPRGGDTRYPLFPLISLCFSWFVFQEKVLRCSALQ